MKTRIMVAGVIILGIAIGFIALNGNPSPDNGQSPSPGQGTDLSAQPVQQFDSQTELNTFVTTQQDSDTTRNYLSGAAAGLERQMDADGAVTTGSSGGAAQREYSTTNVQETGVDEADITKNDGTYLYTISDNYVSIVRAYPPNEGTTITNMTVPGEPRSLFLYNDTLVVFGSSDNSVIMPEAAAGKPSPLPPYRQNTMFIQTYDVSEPKSPQLQRNVSIQGSYVDARMINGTVHTITNTPVEAENGTVNRPTIAEQGEARTMPASDIYYIDAPAATHRYTNILSFEIGTQDRVDTTTLLMDTSHKLYVSHNNIYLTRTKRMPQQEMLQRIIEDGIMPSVPSSIQERLQAVQESQLRQYNSFVYAQAGIIREILMNYTTSLSKQEKENFATQLHNNLQDVAADLRMTYEQTAIHRIAINDNSTVSYAAKGTVPGTVLDQFSMDETDSYFRIATTTDTPSVPFSRIPGTPPTATTEDTAVVEETVSQATTKETLREAETLNHMYILDMNLSTVSSVENLAPDESIHSARFMQDRAYLVTFRQIDPLFAIDLSDPQQPEVLGELKITGVSEYLHPYDQDHLIGIGREADRDGRQDGLKVSLFDVSDPTNPQETASHVFGQDWSHSTAFSEHKAVLFDRNRQLLAFPADVERKTGSSFQGAYVFDITESDIALRGTVTHETNISEKRHYRSYGTNVRRLFYIEDMLYTVSQDKVTISDLTTLEPQTTIPLPGATSQKHPLKEPHIEPGIER